MQPNPVMLPIGGCSATAKAVGRLAIVGGALAVLGVLMVDCQLGGHGEMGSFYYANTLWFLGFGGWGIGTGIGLLRAWRWARISALILGGMFAAVGSFGVVAFLTMPAGNLSGGMLLAARLLPTLFCLIPTSIGCCCLVFFSRKDVKAYFELPKGEPR